MGMQSVLASELAAFLGKSLIGADCLISRPVPVSEICAGSVAFAKKYSLALVESINGASESIAIVCPDFAGKLKSAHVISDNPRLDYLRIIKKYFYMPISFRGGKETSTIEQGAVIGKNVRIGHRCYIGPEVTIGEDTEIHHNVIILGRTNIGARCIVKSGAVIGEEGFGFEYDADGNPEHFPHIGKIEIADDVFIGSNSTIERATIDVTRLEANVKVDDLVQIGHNCLVGGGTLIMAGVILCGGAKIGKRCWIAPNTVVKEKVEIGDETMTGLSSVVIKDIESGVVVAGSPARVLRKR